MKFNAQLFSLQQIKLKYHLNTDVNRFNSVLNSQVDTLLGLDGEVLGEGLVTHKKKYRGVIRPDYFEIKSKFIAGIIETYDPWILRGDLNEVGSNLELSLSTKRTNSLRKTVFPFTVLPILIMVIWIFKENKNEVDYGVVCIFAVLLIAYNSFSRWLQFKSINQFTEILSKSFSLSKIP